MSTLTRRCFPAFYALVISLACSQLPTFGQTPLNGANTIGVFRATSNGAWIINASGTDAYQGGVPDPVFYFGLPGDQPVVGNWTGASPAVLQVGVFRDGYWYLDWDNNEMWDVNPGGGGDVVVGFGLAPSDQSHDIPVVGDWNHDGTLHIGVFRIFSDGSAFWYVQTGCAPVDGVVPPVCDYDPDYTAVFSWGMSGDVPVVGDWDGTGTLRVGVDRSGTWIVNLATCEGDVPDCNGYPETTPETTPGDVGLPYAFSFGSGIGTPAAGNWSWSGGSLGYVSPGTFNNGTWSVVDKNEDPYATSPWYYGLAGDVPVVGPWRNSAGLAHPPPSTPNVLSINGEGNTGGALPGGAPATFAFTFYDSYYGANGIESGQVILASNGNPNLCNLYWWRPGGTYDLYLNTNGANTSSFNTNVSDSYCTVSLVSIVNSTSDPTAVTVTLNYTFSAANAPGSYSVSAYLWDVTGETSTAWGAVGTWTIDGPTVQITDLTQTTGYYFSGDAYEITVTGAPNQAVSASTNGASPATSSGWNTGGQGALTITGNFVAGSYSQVWYVGSVAATPSLLYTVELTNDTSGLPSIPNSYTALPPVLPCTNITGNWIAMQPGYSGAEWDLVQTGNRITGTSYIDAPASASCPGGVITAPISGSVSGSIITLSSPGHPGCSSPLSDTFSISGNSCSVGSNTSGALTFQAKTSASNPVPTTTPTAAHFAVSYSGYIPVDHVQGPTPCAYTFPFQQLPVAIPMIYKGDANRGTYRVTQWVVTIPNSATDYNQFFQTGDTRNYGFGSPANGPNANLDTYPLTTDIYLGPYGGKDEDGVSLDCFYWNESAQPSKANMQSFPVSYTSSTQAQVDFSGTASNPLELISPPYVWNMNVVIDDSNPTSPTAYVNYNHTCFPAHIVKVNGTVVYSYQPNPTNVLSYATGCLFQLPGFPKVIGVSSPVPVPTQ